VTAKLGAYPIDYAEKLRAAGKSEDAQNHQQYAGVLLLLYFRKYNSPADDNEGEFFFRLIRRSNSVQQAGDLACPGGMLHTRLDWPLKMLIAGGLIPLLSNEAGQHARRRDKETYNALTLFLANAAREAWEEIRLNPFRTLFLGPLPSHPLLLFKRTIFPLVGFIKSTHLFRPNHEVESIVDIPLKAFFQQENYGTITTVPDKSQINSSNRSRTMPCLILPDSEGREDILWGATFAIVTNFLKIILDFKMPEVQNGISVKKIIDVNYLSNGNCAQTRKL